MSEVYGYSVYDNYIVKASVTPKYDFPHTYEGKYKVKYVVQPLKKITLEKYRNGNRVETVNLQLGKRGYQRYTLLDSALPLNKRKFDCWVAGLGYTLITCGNWALLLKDESKYVFKRFVISKATYKEGFYLKYVIPTKRYAYILYCVETGCVLLSIDVKRESAFYHVFGDRKLVAKEKRHSVQPRLPFGDLYIQREGDSVLLFTESGLVKVTYSTVEQVENKYNVSPERNCVLGKCLNVTHFANETCCYVGKKKAYAGGIGGAIFVDLESGNVEEVRGGEWEVSPFGRVYVTNGEKTIYLE